MKMSWIQLFGLLLFSAHVYGSSQLAVNPLSLIYLYLTIHIFVQSWTELNWNAEVDKI